MRRFFIFGLPVVAILLLIVAAVVARGGSSSPPTSRQRRKEPVKEMARLEQPAPIQRTAPPVNLKPIPPPASEEKAGVAFYSAGLKSRVSVYVHAAARGDEATRKAMLKSLTSESSWARSVVQERLAMSDSAPEKEILKTLLGSLQ